LEADRSWLEIVQKFPSIDLDPSISIRIVVGIDGSYVENPIVGAFLVHTASLIVSFPAATFALLAGLLSSLTIYGLLASLLGRLAINGFAHGFDQAAAVFFFIKRALLRALLCFIGYALLFLMKRCW